MLTNLLVACACLLERATAAPSPEAPAISQQPPSSSDEEEEISELEEEVGDRDPTYLRTRVVLRVDRRGLANAASADRFRTRLLYAFGPKRRFAVSFLEPFVRADTALRTATGYGDAESQLLANVWYRERFRMGVAIQSTLNTSSDPLLGAPATSLKPSWDVAAVLSSRIELIGALSYKHSVHTTAGIPARQLEPDVVVNARALETTWFLEWDSFYDVHPGQFAQTLKPGVSRSFGANRRWSASGYYSIALNEWARLTQYRYNAGLDMTWYPGASK
jgi:hypothetical protein